jgi:hypothetical protein
MLSPYLKRGNIFRFLCFFFHELIPMRSLYIFLKFLHFKGALDVFVLRVLSFCRMGLCFCPTVTDPTLYIIRLISWYLSPCRQGLRG